MPTFKHPCPRCGNFIQRDVQVCPFCGAADPFAPGRCPNCRKILDDPKWIACPNCGASLVAPPPGTVGTGSASGPATAGANRPGALWGPGAATVQPSQPEPRPAASAPVQPPSAPVPASAPAVPPATAPVTPARTCTGCGAPLAPGARFCTSCGTLAG